MRDRYKFDLEALEPRLLLSGDGLAGVGSPAPVLDAIQDSPVEQVIESGTPLSESLSELSASTNVFPFDLFEGAEDFEPLAADGGIIEVGGDAESPVTPETEELSDVSDNAIEVQGTIEETTGGLVANFPAFEDAFPSVENDGSSTFAAEAVDTLHAANGPPAVSDSDRSQASGSVFVYEAPLTGKNDLLLKSDGQHLILIDKASNVELATQSLASLSSVLINGADDLDDTLTVDFSIPFWLSDGIVYHGGARGFDVLNFEGNGSAALDYEAVGADSAALVIREGGFSMALSFTGLEPVTVSSLSEFTFDTSVATIFSDNSAPASPGIDLITIDSPGVGQNRITGTSGGKTFESVTFQDVTSVTINTGANDTASDRDDQVTITADGLVASGLQNLTVQTGAGADEFIIEAAALSLPVSGGGDFVRGWRRERSVGDPWRRNCFL